MIARWKGDAFAGIVLALLGLGVIAMARSYAIGVAARMGPGYFPLLLGGLLALLGALIAVKAYLAAPQEAILAADWRALAWVPLAILLFAFAIERFGLVAASLVLILAAGLASRQTRLLELPILAVAMAAAAVLIFAKGLGMPLRIWFF